MKRFIVLFFILSALLISCEDQIVDPQTAGGEAQFNKQQLADPKLTVQLVDDMAAKITVKDAAMDTVVDVRKTTFWQRQLVSGNEYSVNVEREGFYSYTLPAYKLTTDLMIPLRLIREDQKVGRVKINSNPSGARVYKNGSFFTITPGEGHLPVGEYNLLVEKEGYQSESQTISLADGDMKELDFNLAQITSPVGYLSIDLNVPARVDTVGDTGQRAVFRVGSFSKAQLPPGGYDLFFTYEGYADTSVYVGVFADSTTQIKINTRKVIDVNYIKPTAVVTIDPASAEVPAEVKFSAEQSFANSSTIVAYEWFNADGVVLGSSKTLSQTISTSGSHYRYVKVTDSNGNSDVGYALFNGNDPDEPVYLPPTAKATVDPQNAEVPAPVTFDGTGSTTNQDGATIVTYEWTDADGTKMSSEATYTTTISKTGITTLYLKVTDSNGKSDIDHISFFGQDADDPQVFPPVAVAKVDKATGYVPLEVKFDAGDSYVNTDGSRITSYEWTDEVGRLKSQSQQYTENFTEAGLHYRYLKITDSNDLKSNDKVAVYVKMMPPVKPTAVVTIDPASAEVPAEVKFSAEQSFANSSTIVAYEWFNADGVVLGSSKTLSQTISTSGSHYRYVKVTDSNGNSDVGYALFNGNDPDEPVYLPPTAKATVDPQNAEVPAPVTFDGTGSTTNQDGATIVTYEWTDADGTKMSSEATYTTTISKTGITTLYLKVTDSNGKSDIDHISFFGQDADDPQVFPPVAVMRATPQVGQAPHAVLLDLNQSYSNESSINSYQIVDSKGEVLSYTAQFEITIDNPGVYTYYGTVTDENGLKSTDKISVYVLPKSYMATVRVYSEPDSVWVLANNKYIGQTDENGELEAEVELESESEEILFTGVKNGYKNYSTTAVMESGATTDVNLVLKKIQDPVSPKVTCGMVVSVSGELYDSPGRIFCNPDVEYDVAIKISGATSAVLQIITRSGTEILRKKLNGGEESWNIGPLDFDHRPVIFYLEVENDSGQRDHAWSVAKRGVILNFNPF